MAGIEEQDDALLLLWQERHVGAKVREGAAVPDELCLANFIDEPSHPVLPE